MEKEEPKQLQSGETVRCYITSSRWIDIHHNGWHVEASSPRGVKVLQDARDTLTVLTVDPADEDEI